MSDTKTKSKGYIRKMVCKDCPDAECHATGSTIFYICKKTGHYRSIADLCDI